MALLLKNCRLVVYFCTQYQLVSYSTWRHPLKATKSKKNGASSYDRILKAALGEFANKGIDGARVDEISRISGVNKNMIYHYFKSKENLFTAVLENVYENVRTRQEDSSLRSLDPTSAMRRLIERTADIWIAVPEFNRLLASEN